MQNLYILGKDVYRIGTKYTYGKQKSIQIILCECLHKFVDDAKF